MVWTRGSSEIWDHYAEVIGDDGWNWESMKPFWNKVGDALFTRLSKSFKNFSNQTVDMVGDSTASPNCFFPFNV